MLVLAITVVLSCIIFIATAFRVRHCLATLYILISIFIVTTAIPALFYLGMGYTGDIEGSEISFAIQILSLNFIVAALYLFYKRSVIGSLRHLFNTAQNVGPSLNIDTGSFKKTRPWGDRTGFFVLYGYLFIKIIQLLVMDSFSIGANRDEVWKANAQLEAETGMGVLGVFELIWNGLYFVALHSLLISDSSHYKRYAYRIFTLITLLSILIIAVGGLVRSPVVFHSVTWILVTHLYVKRINIYRISIVGVFVIPMFLSFAALVRAGSVGSESVSILHGMTGLLTAYEFGQIISSLKNGYLQYEYGLQYIYSLISFVPRFIWVEKPHTSFSFRISEKIYGEAGESAWVHTFTPWGEGYLQFGIAGTFLNMVIIFFLIHFIVFIIKKWPCVLIYVIANIFILTPILLRADLSSLVAQVHKLIVVLIIIIFYKALFRSNYYNLRREL